ncbi:discoidin domain-containing protein [Lachnospiraceae bacterium 46-15]
MGIRKRAGTAVLCAVMAFSGITLPGEAAADVSAISVSYHAESNKVVVEAPEGITFSGADFEQVVADDLSVHQPLTAKEVKLAFKDADGNPMEKPLTIPGLHEAGGGNEKPQVIPEIAEWYSDSNGRFRMNESSRIVLGSEELRYIGEEFQKDLEDITGKKLSVVQGTEASAKEGDFFFALGSRDAMLGEEGYAMEIGGTAVTEGTHTTGVYWATRTILQMIKLSGDGISMSQGQMRDYPKYAVRSFVFDVARKAVSMDMLRDVAKNMAWYKMNDFQVHLNDNLIFLEDYYDENEPDPTDAFAAYSGYRLESGVEKDGKSIASADYHYTKEEFRSFIQECRKIGMNIVPEIDVPAHAMAITGIFREYAVNGWTPGNSRRSLVDHLDVTRPEVVEFIKTVFDEYIEDRTFDENTVIHVGADEFMADATAYREFMNEILCHIKKTNIVRLWGGLTRIVDNKTEILPEAAKGSQINLWSKDWADGLDMYNLGFDLINTLDTYGYMVPSGGTGRGAYQDYIDKSLVYNSFAPNVVRRKDASNVALPAGDKQILGGAFALWQDEQLDTHATGLSEEDLFTRFFDALPFYAEKTWANGQEKGSVGAIDGLAGRLSIAPNTNPYGQQESDDGIYAEYDFETRPELDNTLMARDLTELKNAVAVPEDGNMALKLSGGESYAQTPLTALGSTEAKSLSFTMDLEEVKPGQILFEADAPYGTHDIRITENNKLGFTRELYIYEFDYMLTPGKKEIRIETGAQHTSLYVDGEFAANAKGKYVYNGQVKKENIGYSSLALPLQRIGSRTNAVKGLIDNVQIADVGHDEAMVPADDFIITSDNENALTGNGTEGPASLAFDGNTETRWHSQHTPSKKELPASIMIDMGAEYEINSLVYLPRQDAGEGNGNISRYKLSMGTDGETYPDIITSGIWEADSLQKKAVFSPVRARYLKFTAEEGKNGWASAAEIGFGMAVSQENGDKAELQRVFETCRTKINEGNTQYTPDSWQVFQRAFANAKGVLGRECVSQEKIDAVCAELVRAERELILRPVPPPIPQPGDELPAGQPKPQPQPEKPLPLPAIYKDARLVYRVTAAAGSTGTVTVMKPLKKTQTSVVIPAEVKIDGHAFKVTAIADKAFRGNKKLKKAVIGANVVKIGKESFSGCRKLKNITINSSKLKSVGKNAFKNIPAKAKMKVPKKKLAVYKKYLKKAKLGRKVKVVKK